MLQYFLIGVPVTFIVIFNLGYVFHEIVAKKFFEKTIIMPFSSGKLAAINVEDGQLAWSSSLSVGLGVKSYINDIDMVPVIKDKTVFLSSINGILYAIDAKDGALKWTNTQAGGGDQIWETTLWASKSTRSSRRLLMKT